jgi:predicted DNA-binding transcriptional regulator AlpA
MNDDLNFIAGADAPAERLLTTTEASLALGVSPAFLANLRVKGGGPRFFKLGHAVRYSREQLIEWARGRERASTSQ